MGLWKDETPVPEEMSRKSWLPVLWDDEFPGYAIHYRENDNMWEFSFTLPDEADPSSIILNCAFDSAREERGFYTVQYLVTGTNFWRLLEIPMLTERDNLIAVFSAHTLRDFEKVIGFNNISKGSAVEL